MNRKRFMIEPQILPPWLYNEFQSCGVNYANHDVACNFESRHLCFRDFEEEFERVCERTGLSSNDDVLDLGCGTGAFVIPAAKRCHSVYGVDVSEVMLELLRNKLKSQGVYNVSLYNAGFLTFWKEKDRPKQFDFIISSIALHHLPDFWKAVAIQHIADALKPGGIFYLYDVVFTFSISNWREGVQHVLDEMELAAGHEASTHISSEYSSFSWYLEGIFDRVGLKVEQVFDDYSFLRTYLCRKTKNSDTPVLTVAESRELDAEMTRRLNIPATLLMENASRSIADIFLANAQRLHNGSLPRRVLICCGKGNNGGDGFALFRRLELLGIDCRVVTSAPFSDYKGDSLLNLKIVKAMTENAKDKLFYFDGSNEAMCRLIDEAKRSDWIVDALLGTGAQGILRPPYDLLISTINASGTPILAIDVPSGLNADDGSVATMAIKATLTVTLATLKPGLLTEEGARYVGEVHVGDIGAPVEALLKKQL